LVGSRHDRGQDLNAPKGNAVGCERYIMPRRRCRKSGST